MNLKALILILILPLSAWAKAPGAREVKADTLSYLRELRTQNVTRLQEIEETLSKKIENDKPAELETEVRRLKLAQREHQLRQEFLNRLIFQIDTKYTGGDLRAFLENALKDMAKVDAITSAVDMGLWKFLRFAADAVRQIPEHKENIVIFLEGYMNRSVSNPVQPSEYLNSRNYTNGSMSESGTPVSPEEAGAIADRRLQELDQEERPTTTVPATH